MTQHMGALEEKLIQMVQRQAPNKVREETFSKGEIVFSENQICRNVFFVKQGLLKASVNTEDGKEVTKWFSTEGDIVASTQGLLLKQEAGFFLSCIEETKCMTIVDFDLNHFMKQDHEFSQTVALYAFALAAKKEKRELDFLIKSPEDQLQSMIVEKPELVERLSQLELAKYLGITPVALSRIKRRLV